MFLPSTTAMDLFALDGLSNLLVRARDKVSIEPAIEEVTDILRRRHGDLIDFTVISQDDMLSTVNGIMATMSMLLLLAIAAISLVVGGIGIANIMLVSVRERTRGSASVAPSEPSGATSCCSSCSKPSSSRSSEGSWGFCWEPHSLGCSAGWSRRAALRLSADIIGIAVGFFGAGRGALGCHAGAARCQPRSRRSPAL